MSRIAFTIDGYLAADLELHMTQSGKKVANVTVPHTRSKYNEQTRKYESQGETLWVRASFWEADADAVMDGFAKGDQVILTATGAHTDAYEGKKRLGSNLILEFATIAKVTRGRRQSSGGYQADERYAPGNQDVWSSNPPQPPDDGWVPPSAPSDDETPF